MFPKVVQVIPKKDYSVYVYFEDGKNMFLGAGKSAKAFHVSALKRWDIPFLVTAGTLLDEIAEEDDGIEELEPLDDDEPAELEEI